MNSTYTQEQLQAAFAEVQHKKDWKASVSRLMFKPGVAKRALIEEAVMHFTGSEVTWTDKSPSSPYTRIEFAGYTNTEAEMFAAAGIDFC